MPNREIRTVLVGDSTSLEKAMSRVGAESKDMAGDLDRAAGEAKHFGSAIDRATERTDRSERTFMGTADVLDGLAAAFGLPIDRAVELGRAGGDLAGGFTTLGPTIKGFGSTLGAVATGPVGLIIAGIAAVAAGLVILWKNSETFRDIVTAAFEAVKNVLGPVGDFFGNVFGKIGDLFGGSGDDAEAMAERQKQAVEEMRAAYEENLAKVTSVLDEMANPLERFNHENETTLAEVVENLRFNVEEYQKWSDDIKVIRARFGEDVAQFVIDQGAEWHGLADQLANSTGDIGGQFAGLIQHLEDLEEQAGDTASGVEENMRNMAQQLMADLGPLAGLFVPLTGVPTGRAPVNRSPIVRGSPFRHSGGIVPGPLGSEVPIVAQAGERVVPMGQSAGGGTQVVQLVIDKQVVTEVVLEGLLARQRRSGNLGIEAA